MTKIGPGSLHIKQHSGRTCDDFRVERLASFVPFGSVGFLNLLIFSFGPLYSMKWFSLLPLSRPSEIFFLVEFFAR